MTHSVAPMAEAISPDAQSPVTVLMDMRPALDGFYGTPQETRLLFSALAGLPDLRVSGLLCKCPPGRSRVTLRRVWI